MSDSDLSPTPANVPFDSDIERALKRITRELADDTPTVNAVRNQTEINLSLPAGFFKNHDTWKDRSKQIIHAAIDDEASSPEKPKKPDPKQKAKLAPKAGKKRKSDEEPPKKRPTKKARNAASDDGESDSEVLDSEDDDDFEEEERKPAKRAKKAAPKPANKIAKKPVKKPTKKKAISDSEGEDEELSEAEPVEDKSAAKVDSDEEVEEPPTPKSKPAKPTSKEESELSDVPDDIEKEEPKANGAAVAAEDSESDMSVLIDKPPKKKRQKKSTSTEPKSKSKGAATKAAKPKAGKELSADEEEIKRLQGWLVKCGIRKMWWKELQPFPTAKEKTKHLKKMLEDAGMGGRYSNEKAKQIKESRELAAELEAVEEFNDRWGQSDEDEGERKADAGAGAKQQDDEPKKRLPKGFIDFGDSGDDGSD